MRANIKSFLKNFASRSPFRAQLVAISIRTTLAIRASISRWTRHRNFFLDSTVKITGWKSISFGPNCAIGQFSWLNVNHRDGTEPLLVIGANSFIGQYNFFTVGRKIYIGEYVLTASNCSFIGSSHVANDPFQPYLTTGTTGDAIIEIGANCFFGYGSQVLGNVRVGFGSIIGAQTIVRADIPPLSMVAGTPARVVKRYSVSRAMWVKAEEFGDETLPSEQEYLQRLRQNHPNLLMPLSAAASHLSDI